MREVTPERFERARWYDPARDAAGKSYVRAAALLDFDDIAGFDPAPFGISPREARHLDPQHRLLLACAWEALERAGAPPTDLAESPTGVFIGIAPGEYAGGEAAYGITGQDSAFAAGRLAYTLGLQGPTLALNTTCSSSLVALHLAVRALRAGECRLALVGGANVLLGAAGFVALSAVQALAPDGRSKTFAAAADGFGRGEGAVVVALEPLAAAQAAGRPILGVIRGSAINHDGASSGITVPSGAAQQQVIGEEGHISLYVGGPHVGRLNRRVLRTGERRGKQGGGEQKRRFHRAANSCCDREGTIAANRHNGKGARAGRIRAG